MFKRSLFIILILTVLFPVQAHASYFSEMKRDWGRGLKNILSFPLEIPITVQEYHESAGYPVVRHAAGLADGIFQAVSRLGSGLWDLVPASIIPGIQEGLPVTPETLF